LEALVIVRGTMFNEDRDVNGKFEKLEVEDSRHFKSNWIA